MKKVDFGALDPVPGLLRRMSTVEANQRHFSVIQREHTKRLDAVTGRVDDIAHSVQGLTDAFPLNPFDGPKSWDA